MDFKDRTVVVTGGTGALGRAVVTSLIGAGARCRVPYIVDAEAQAFPKNERVTLVRCDLVDEKQVGTLYAEADGLWASIHLAGGFTFAPIAKSDKGVLTRMLEMNLVSAYLCARAAIAKLGDGEGRIVNVAARQAVEPRLGAGMTAYTAAKAALAALTQALAAEVKDRRILVNAVAPSIIDTPANRKDMPEANFALWPKPEEIAATIVFLASPDNRLTSGAIVPQYGGA